MKTGKDFLSTLIDDCKTEICPICLKSCDKTSLVDLLWVWEVCHCDKVAYAHLRPTIYHKRCFGDGNPAKNNKSMNADKK